MHGVRVRLYQGPRGHIYRAVVVGRTVSANGKPRTVEDRASLGHSNRQQAEEEARALCRELANARLNGVTSAGLTLGQLFMAYRQHRLPMLTPARQQEARARITMFQDAWTSELKVADVDRARVDAYVEARRSLAIVSPGLRPRENGESRRGYRKPRPIRDGGLDAELRWLSSVFNWARGFRVNGKRLLAENPLDALRGHARRTRVGRLHRISGIWRRSSIPTP